MSSPNPVQRLTVRQFADRIKGEMVPLGNRFRYFCAALSLGPEDLKEYLDEPVAALPPKLAASLPQIQILLVPYLRHHEAGQGRKRIEIEVSTEKPDEDKSSLSSALIGTPDTVLAFAVKETEVADYHYRFYRAIAEIAAGHGIPPIYATVLRDEIRAGAHGEVDDASWRLKLELREGDAGAARAPRRFTAYIRQSFVDTLTLYLHGICCDIDVDPGPRQLASNLIRKRLRWFREMYPPPDGYAVLPEDAKS
ncbi:MAG TPA: hypothetical protein PKJ41_05480 [Bryobacteraceae bacterium]|nr:hypothetical protein [Bryobacteraceae bacterium]HPT25998.1 hypothetical protein [Bryobacteraceae bacterium]